MIERCLNGTSCSALACSEYAPCAFNPSMLRHRTRCCKDNGLLYRCCIDAKYTRLALVRKTSRLVSLPKPVSVSSLIAIAGLFECGVMSIRVDIASWRISTLASTDWGKCRFISPPPVSALYGAVQLCLEKKIVICLELNVMLVRPSAVDVYLSVP